MISARRNRRHQGLRRHRRAASLLAILTLLATGLPNLVAEAPRDANTTSTAPFAALREHADRFVVQIETVGGVRPGGASSARVQGEASEEDGPPAPRRFTDNAGSAFPVADGPTTGIVYSADGLILASSFNFVREPAVITVRLPDGRQLPASLVARDAVRKLALLKVAADNLTPPLWTPREDVRAGQWAVAVGRGHGAAESVLAVGIVSALNRMMGNAIQTDAPLSPANYGGPLLDSHGRVLGICVPMAQRPGELAGVELYDSGIGFAIPGWRVEEIAAQLREGRSFQRGWLGMTVDPHAEDSVIIHQIADPSPLKAAGAQQGDQIVEINGRPIEHYGQMVQATYMLPAGEMLEIKLKRGEEVMTLEVPLAASDELGDLPPVEEPFDPAQPQSEESAPPAE